MMRMEQVERIPYEPLERKLYAYRVINSPVHEGLFKIGQTDRSVEERIHEQVGTSGLNAEFVLAVPARHTDGRLFTDTDFHHFLMHKGVRRSNLNNSAQEWFAFDNDVTKLKEYLEEFIARSPTDVQGTDEGYSGYVLREEQENAVTKTLHYMTTHTDAEFLWNAKPRFGKTLSSYDLVRRLKAEKRNRHDMTAMNVLIVTNRPAIANSWYDDFVRFIGWQEKDLRFVSETSALEGTDALTREAFVELAKQDDNTAYGCIAFVSLQDLKGARLAGGQHDKLQWIWDLHWDLMIIDESHEGVATDKTERAFAHIRREATLHLSGTPFKALASGLFTDEQIYNWTYMDEQEMKASWPQQKHGTPMPVSPYDDLPTLHMFTYRMGDAVVETLKKGTKIGEKDVDYAFYLNEFFATDRQGRFIHEDDVRQFLDNLHQRRYPFSEGQHRDQLAHTFWLLQRVDSAKALAKMLHEHPFFRDYYVVIAAGDGRDLRADDCEGEIGQWDRWSETALTRVRRAIAEHDKTITLSVGQLTTGVTVPEWTAVLILSDIESPERYFQAAFRAQNPYRYIDKKTGIVYKKERAYVFDFAPERTLRLLETMATKLISNVDSVTDDERKDYIRRLLNYFPVIGEDEDGVLGEFTVEDVMTVPLRNIAREVVARGFLHNGLFLLDHVIGAPPLVQNILSKLSPDKNKKIQRNSEVEIPTNLQEEVTGEDIVIAPDDLENPLGEGIWESVPVTSDENEQQEWLERVQAEYEPRVKAIVAATDFTPIREKYDLNKKESNKVEKKVTEQVTKQLVVNEKEHLNTLHDITDTYDVRTQVAKTKREVEILKQEREEALAAERERHERLQRETIEREIRNAERIAQEMRRREKEEDIRDHLRGFSRSVPMFLMAWGDRKTTLANYDQVIDDNDFADVTGITIQEFRVLRDGCDYLDADGTKRHFAGSINEAVFNRSVQEFFDLKERLDKTRAQNDTEDIFDYIPQQEENRVFTPRAVVVRMLDALQAQRPDVFRNKNTCFADFYVKSGIFLAELVKRLYQGLATEIPDDEKRLDWILTNQIYGAAPSETLRRVAANYVYGAFDKRSCAHIKNWDFSKLDSAAWASYIKIEWGKDMKFDIIIGNPPYQEPSDENRPTRDKPLYHLFVDRAYAAADRVMLIHPARFLFDAGATPKEWNQKMLADTHLKIIDYQPDAGQVFPSTDIKGGVCITYRDKKKNFGAVGVFIPFAELQSIVKKVTKNAHTYMDGIVGSQNMYCFTEQLHREYPNIKEKLSTGHAYDVATSVFSSVPEIFYQRAPKDGKEYIRMYGFLNRKRCYRWVRRDFINNPAPLGKYTVMVPKSNGSGALGEGIATPLIGPPLIGHTQTFLSIGAFATEAEAAAALKYIKTKFARVMLGVLKVTQDNPAPKWRYVPMQDFTAQSDIDWTKSVAEIDQQLYRKYKLNKKEIRFIEEKVAPMV